MKLVTEEEMDPYLSAGLPAPREGGWLCAGGGLADDSEDELLPDSDFLSLFCRLVSIFKIVFI